MYKVVAQELVGIGEEQRFIGEARKCRFCGTSDSSDFGKKQMHMHSLRGWEIKLSSHSENAVHAIQNFPGMKMRYVRLLALILRWVE